MQDFIVSFIVSFIGLYSEMEFLFPDSFGVWYVSIVRLAHEVLCHTVQGQPNPAIFHDTTYKCKLLFNNIKVTA